MNSTYEVLLGGTLWGNTIVPHVMHEFRFYRSTMVPSERDIMYNSLVTKWGGQSFV